MTRVLVLTVALFAPMMLEGCCLAPGEPEPTAEEIAAAEKEQEREYARIEYVGGAEERFSSVTGQLIDVSAEGARHEVFAIISPIVGGDLADLFREGGELVEELKTYGFETMRLENSDTKQEWVLALSEIPSPGESGARVERPTPAPSSTGSTTTTTSSSSSSTTSGSERTSSGSSSSPSQRRGVRRGGTSRGGQNTKRVSRPGKK